MVDMINKITTIILIVLLLIPASLIAQPLKEVNEDWDPISQSIEWEPVEMKIKLGDAEVKVWLLHSMVPAPISGYMLKKPDFADMKRILDNLDKEVERVKQKERSFCDKLLVEKDVFCRSLNKDLIKQIDSQKIVIVSRDDKIKSLNSELFWTKIISGTVVLGLSAFSIYSLAK